MKHFTGISEQSKASVIRKTDAERLRDADRWRGAMYLLGYAIECALKARLMERIDVRQLYELGDHLSRRLRRPVDVFTHSLHVLMNWTEAEHRMDRPLLQAWGVIRKWDVDWRYSPHGATEEECDEFFEAAERVLRFIRHSI